MKVATHDLDQLLSFEHLGFTDVVRGLRRVADLLQDYTSFGLTVRRACRSLRVPGFSRFLPLRRPGQGERGERDDGQPGRAEERVPVVAEVAE